jgi:hypothetical protein
MPWSLYWTLFAGPSVAIFTFRFVVCLLLNPVGDDPLHLRNPGLPEVLGVQWPPPAGYGARIPVCTYIMRQTLRIAIILSE